MISFVGKTETKGASYHVIKTNDNGKSFFVSIKNKELPIGNSGIERKRIVFSRPCNNRHPAWTQREITNVQDSLKVNTMWTPLKPGLQVRGYTKGDQFVVTHIKLDTKIYKYETN